VAEAVAKSQNPVRRGGFSWIGWAALLIVGLPGAWLLRGRVQSNSEPVNPNAVKSVLHLDTFVLNLADPDERAYLRVGIDLGLTTDLQAAQGSNAPPVALIRDTILGVLATAKPQDLLLPQGKAKLKEDLLLALRNRDPALGVQEVYFTEFLIQR